MLAIGYDYWQGVGVEKDIVLAKIWMTKSADAGNRAAMVDLGDLYEDSGPDHASDFLSAAKWFSKGAAVGDSGSMYNLASLYE